MINFQQRQGVNANVNSFITLFSFLNLKNKSSYRLLSYFKEKNLASAVFYFGIICFSAVPVISQINTTITIKQNTNNYLNLSEVKVYSGGEQVSNTLFSTSESSNYGGVRPASNLIDGDEGTIAHSVTATPIEWFKLTYYELLNIDSIRIKNRGDGDAVAARSQNLQLIVAQGVDTLYNRQIDAYQDDSDGALTTWDMNAPIVLPTTITIKQNTNNYLNLSEVKVYSGGEQVSNALFTTSESSNYGGVRPASNLIDGDEGTIAHSVTATPIEWFKLTYYELLNIDSIRIKNRGDGDAVAARSQNLQLIVAQGVDTLYNRQIDAYQDDSDGALTTWDMNPPIVLPTTITIKQNTNNYLNLSEVKVYSGGEQVSNALFTTSESSNYGGVRPASNLIDGDEGTIAHSVTATPIEWFKLTYYELLNIDSIRIKNRGDGDAVAARSQNLQLIVAQGVDTLYNRQIDAYQDDSDGALTTWDMNPPIVLPTTITIKQNTNNYLNLSEVKVYSGGEQVSNALFTTSESSNYGGVRPASNLIDGDEGTIAHSVTATPIEWFKLTYYELLNIDSIRIKNRGDGDAVAARSQNLQLIVAQGVDTLYNRQIDAYQDDSDGALTTWDMNPPIVLPTTITIKQNTNNYLNLSEVKVYSGGEQVSNALFTTSESSNYGGVRPASNLIDGDEGTIAHSVTATPIEWFKLTYYELLNIDSIRIKNRGDGDAVAARSQNLQLIVAQGVDTLYNRQIDAYQDDSDGALTTWDMNPPIVLPTTITIKQNTNNYLNLSEVKVYSGGEQVSNALFTTSESSNYGGVRPASNLIDGDEGTIAHSVTATPIEWFKLTYYELLNIDSIRIKNRGDGDAVAARSQNLQLIVAQGVDTLYNRQIDAYQDDSDGALTTWDMNPPIVLPTTITIKQNTNNYLNLSEVKVYSGGEQVSNALFTTSESSNYGGVRPASNLIDGDEGTIAHSVTATPIEWFKLTYYELLNIDSIRIKNRGDGDAVAARSQNLQLIVAQGVDTLYNRQIDAYQDDSDGALTTWDMNPPIVLPTTITIKQNTNNYLNLSEVKVYSGGEQVSNALFTTSESSNYGGVRPASNLIDGDEGTFAVSATANPNQWFKLTYDGLLNIDSIRIKNRQHDNPVIAARSQNLQLIVAQGVDTLYNRQIDAYQDDSDGALTTWDMNPPIVLPTTITIKQNTNNYLNLSEVKVYSGGEQVSNALFTPSESLIGVYPASNLIDGNEGTFAHSVTATPIEWFKLTYYELLNIDSIRIKNRGDGDAVAARSQNLQLIVAQGVDTLYNRQIDAYQDDSDGALTTWDMNAPIAPIVLPTTITIKQNTNNYLNLSEVKVYSGGEQVSNALFTTSESSNYAGSYPASNLIDGNEGTFAHSVTATPIEWFKLTYYELLNIDSIRIKNRGDGDAVAARSQNLQLIVAQGVDTLYNRQIDAYQDDSDGALTTWDMNPPIVLPTTITIKQNTNNYLNLSEVKVYSGGEQVSNALFTTSESSNYGGVRPASNLIDGDEGTIAHSVTATPIEWFKLTYYGLLNIDSIRIKNRGDGDAVAARSQNLQLIVEQGVDTLYNRQIDAYQDDSDGALTTWDMNPPMSTITIKQNTNNYLNLSEVKVYSGGEQVSNALFTPSESSNYGGVRPASNLIDGDEGTFAVSATATPIEWFKLTYNGLLNIDSIRIKNRQHDNPVMAERSRNLQLIVKSGSRTIYNKSINAFQGDYSGALTTWLMPLASTAVENITSDNSWTARTETRDRRSLDPGTETYDLPGSLDPGTVDLAGGNVTFSETLAGISGYTASINYTSKGVSDYATKVNSLSPTGIVGLGWSFSESLISRTGYETGYEEDDLFSLFLNGSFEHLVLKEKVGDEIHYVTSEKKSWRVTYTDDDSEKWIVTTEDGIQYVFGTISTHDGENALDKGVKWDDWFGPFYNSETGQNFVRNWRLSKIIDTWGNETYFYYNNTLEDIGDLTPQKKYTRENHLKSVKNRHGDSLVFYYNTKNKDEFVDPQQMNAEPDAYQELYDKQYLTYIQVHNNNGDTLHKTILSYDSIAVATPYVEESGELQKRLLTSISIQDKKGNELEPAKVFSYYGQDMASEGLNVSINSDTGVYTVFNQTQGALYGAIKKIISPLGSEVLYKYDKKSIDGSDRAVYIGPSTMNSDEDLFKDALRDSKHLDLKHTPIVHHNEVAGTLVIWPNKFDTPDTLSILNWEGSWKRQNFIFNGIAEFPNKLVIKSSSHFFAVYQKDAGLDNPADITTKHDSLHIFYRDRLTFEWKHEAKGLSGIKLQDLLVSDDIIYVVGASKETGVHPKNTIINAFVMQNNTWVRTKIEVNKETFVTDKYETGLDLNLTPTYLSPFTTTNWDNSDMERSATIVKNRLYVAEALTTIIDARPYTGNCRIYSIDFDKAEKKLVNNYGAFVPISESARATFTDDPTTDKIPNRINIKANSSFMVLQVLYAANEDGTTIVEVDGVNKMFLNYSYTALDLKKQHVSDYVGEQIATGNTYMSVLGVADRTSFEIDNRHILITNSNDYNEESPSCERSRVLWEYFPGTSIAVGPSFYQVPTDHFIDPASPGTVFNPENSTSALGNAFGGGFLTFNTDNSTANLFMFNATENKWYKKLDYNNGRKVMTQAEEYWNYFQKGFSYIEIPLNFIPYVGEALMVYDIGATIANGILSSNKNKHNKNAIGFSANSNFDYEGVLYRVRPDRTIDGTLMNSKFDNTSHFYCGEGFFSVTSVNEHAPIIGESIYKSSNPNNCMGYDTEGEWFFESGLYFYPKSSQAVVRNDYVFTYLTHHEIWGNKDMTNFYKEFNTYEFDLVLLKNGRKFGSIDRIGRSEISDNHIDLDYFTRPTSSRKGVIDMHYGQWNTSVLGGQTIVLNYTPSVADYYIDKSPYLWLSRVVDDAYEGELSDYVVKSVEVSNVNRKDNTFYEYENAMASHDGTDATWGKVTVIPGSLEDKPYGYTEHYFFNDYVSAKMIEQSPSTDAFSSAQVLSLYNKEVPSTFSPWIQLSSSTNAAALLRGAKIATKVFRNDGSSIFTEEGNSGLHYEVIKTYDPVNKYEQFMIRPFFNISSLDNVITRTIMEYDSHGHLKATLSDNFLPDGTTESHVMIQKYAHELVPGMSSSNQFNLIAQTKTGYSSKTAEEQLSESGGISIEKPLASSGTVYDTHTIAQLSDPLYHPKENYRAIAKNFGNFPAEYPNLGTWQKVSSLTLNTSKGNPLQTKNIDDIPTSFIYDKDERNLLASFIGAIEREVVYNGFESYENPLDHLESANTSTVSDPNRINGQVLRTGADGKLTLAYNSGTNGLVLDQLLKHKIGAWVKASAGSSINIGLGTSVTTYTATGKWQYIYHNAAPAPYSDQNSILLLDGPSNCLVDDIFICPALCNFAAMVYDSVYNSPVASLTEGVRNDHIFNKMERRIGNISNEIFGSINLNYHIKNDNFWQVQDHEEEICANTITVSNLSGGLFKKELRNTSEFSATELGTWNNFALYADASNTTTGNFIQSLGLQFGDIKIKYIVIYSSEDFSIGYFYLTKVQEDNTEVQILESPPLKDLKENEWLVVHINGRLLFYCDGHLIFDYYDSSLNRVKTSESIKVTDATENTIYFENVVFVKDPIITSNILDALGRPIQHLDFYSEDEKGKPLVRVVETLYDGWGNPAIVTKPVIYGN